MSQRLYLRPEQMTSSRIELDRDQLHYLSRVLRLKSNAILTCFNGQGIEWQARFVQLDARTGSLELENVLREEPPTHAPVTLAISWLKGAAMDTVVQKSTELGVSRLQVLHSERSNVTVDARRTSNKLRHWQQIAVSASEQSNRLYVPEILPPISVSELLASSGDSRQVMLDLDAALLDVGALPQPLTLLIGPEGGWSDSERQLAESHGIQRASLGELTLRAETTPLVALAVVRHSWGWQR
jgi:16S rRNA (uracil1498-N3)-methyltransferase